MGGVFSPWAHKTPASAAVMAAARTILAVSRRRIMGIPPSLISTR
jgi:hypothetical protein